MPFTRHDKYAEVRRFESCRLEVQPPSRIRDRPVSSTGGGTHNHNYTEEKDMASGDHCRFGRNHDGSPNGTVIHFDCDDFGDNTITDLLSGAVLRYRPKHWKVEANA